MKIVLEKLKIRSISKKMLKIALQKMNSSLLEHSGKIEKQKQTQKSVKKKLCRDTLLTRGSCTRLIESKRISGKCYHVAKNRFHSRLETYLVCHKMFLHKKVMSMIFYLFVFSVVYHKIC